MSIKKRVVYHVTPRRDEGLNWAVKLAGAKKAVKIFTGKDAAIELAKRLAKQESLGQIKIHDKQGKIQTEHTYIKDPEKYKG